MKVWEIWNPALLEAEEIRALFDRAFSDPKHEMDADGVRQYLKAHMMQGGETDKLFVALDTKHGYCGLAIVTLGVYPLSPHPYIAFFVAEKPEAREPLVEACLLVIRKAGYTRFAIHNETGASDKAHARLFRKFAHGDIRGAMIVYDMETRHGG